MSNNVKQLLINNDEIKNYFPISYRLSIPYHTFFWECKPILPIITGFMLVVNITYYYPLYANCQYYLLLPDL